MQLLSAYLHHLFQTVVKGTKTMVLGNTLNQHLKAAETWLKTQVSKPFDVWDRSGSKPKMVPLLHDPIALRKKWQKRKEKRQPYTLAMFRTLRDQVDSASCDDPSASLDLKAAVLDWTRLGIFSGCRCSEYAQTSSKRGEFARVPDTPAAGEWANTPIAFLAEDFTFYDKDMCQLDLLEILHNPDLPFELHLRFRFDKSSNNFVTKKYRRGQGFLCPIDAAISVLSRAHILRVPDDCPVGVFRKGDSFTYIQSVDVIKVMRQAVVDAYPNPKHYLRIHITAIVSHSNRVTAAVVLKSMGLSDEDIAFRLRWHPDTVKHYVRECELQAESLTQAAFQGVHSLSAAAS